ncbi:MAG: fused MFS/spermidine synthase [Acidobacteria bacterium]|nr:fused MFS/spermidine synthase [Acidobacteriota bacterium]
MASPSTPRALCWPASWRAWRSAVTSPGDWPVPASTGGLTAARVVCAVLVLIVPTSLMGSTLPLVAASALGRPEVWGSRLGILYAVNTAGAILGALVGGFYLIADVGVAASFRLAASVNIVIGLAAILMSRWMPRGTPSREAAPTSTPSTPTPPDAAERQRHLVLWVFAASGLMSLALEVTWFRMLVTILRPTAYAFTIMLATVLAGIAGGSALVTPLLRRPIRWLIVLAGLQLAIALAAVLSFNTMARADDIQHLAVSLLASLRLDGYLIPIVTATVAAMLPTTLLLGAAFPIGLKLWTGGVSREAASRRVGVFYSLNVFGAIVGSLAAGFWLLPVLGMRSSLIAVSAIALVSSVALAVSCWRSSPNTAGFLTLVGPVAFVMAALNTVEPFAVALGGLARAERVIWRDEGVQTTVAVHERRASPRVMRIMYLDGMHQANDSGATAFVHHRIGALPMLLHPKPERALVVGLGGGATAGALARYPGVQVDVVELSNEVIRGSNFFTHINFHLLQRPNVRVRVDDGRNHLLVTNERYDVVTADIILPRHAGAGSLYSAEYFQLVRRALRPGGLAVQWIGSEGATEYKLIMRTFMSVFPQTTLWGDGTLMVGSLEPLTLSRAEFETRRQQPGFRDVFDWDFETMRRLYLAGPRELASYVGPGPILTDDRPVIEYFLSLPQNDPPPELAGLVGRPEDVFRP